MKEPPMFELSNFAFIFLWPRSSTFLTDPKSGFLILYKLLCRTFHLKVFSISLLKVRTLFMAISLASRSSHSCSEIIREMTFFCSENNFSIWLPFKDPKDVILILFSSSSHKCSYYQKNLQWESLIFFYTFGNLFLDHL